MNDFRTNGLGWIGLWYYEWLADVDCNSRDEVVQIVNNLYPVRLWFFGDVYDYLRDNQLPLDREDVFEYFNSFFDINC